MQQMQWKIWTVRGVGSLVVLQECFFFFYPTCALARLSPHRCRAVWKGAACQPSQAVEAEAVCQPCRFVALCTTGCTACWLT